MQKTKKQLPLIAAIYLLNIATCFAFAANDSIAKRPNLIDAEQERIDKLDGKLDRYINTGDTATDKQAGFVYFTTVDYIQKVVDKDLIPHLDKINFYDNLFVELRSVNKSNYYRVDELDKKILHVLAGLNALRENNLQSFLLENIPLSIKIAGFFKNSSGIKEFLTVAAKRYPTQVLHYAYLFDDKDYALPILENAVTAAPAFAKKYFLETQPIFRTLKKSSNTAVQTILSIDKKMGKSTNAYVLLDAIENNQLTIESANEIGKEQYAYLKTMLNIRKKKEPLAEHSLEAELVVNALKYVRVVNDLHNEPDNIRFAIVDSFNAAELYTLMVYSEEEIFTSTFNGCFKRLLAKLDSTNGYEFIQQMGENRFRAFIKMAASYGKLDQFLATMKPEQQQQLMVKFASNLELDENDIEQAVEVADAFGSISDSSLLNLLRTTIKSEYKRVDAQNSKRGKVIYGLLSNLFAGDGLFKDEWFSGIAAKYQLPPLDKVNFENLFRRNRHNIWQMYFYDDEDGDASFKTFLAVFKDPNWQIFDYPHYVKIASKSGALVTIYANKPKSEYIGQPQIEKLLDSLKQEPDVMVHRGHSYYAYKTIEKIHSNTAVFILGSCGGYNSLKGIFERSPNVSVVASKQIGTMFVNNPLIKLLAEDIRNFKDINWYSTWSDLETTVKSNKQAYERFLDYIPPHKNLGALFIRAYNRMTEE
ncbi:MAG: hypothetical protein KF872_11045 [Chitinophagales bacterium]|nr:hypothetical protein [Chitinophagales bacterium]